MCDLNSRVKNLIAYKYYKKKFKEYKIAKVIKIASEKFDEKNNMKYSLENFFNHKGVEKNFILTKNINRILK